MLEKMQEDLMTPTRGSQKFPEVMSSMVAAEMVQQSQKHRVLALSTLGHGSYDEHRILELLDAFSPELLPFDRKNKWKSFRSLINVIRTKHPDLIVMEGTGLAGGIPLILGRLLLGQRYVVSSGDAIGPWIATKSRLLAPLFGIYERALCRLANGFIGWTPYLVGRALTFGTPRAMTASGWAPFTRTIPERQADRDAIRKHLGIDSATLVIGIAGSLVWSKRVGYCYGWELVQAAIESKRDDVCWLIVGDGDGKSRLEQAAEKVKHGRILFTGRVPQAELPAYLAAMDIGSLPQSVDGVGSFRYTTKVSEYLAFQLPFITGLIPLAYDFPSSWFWSLPGNAPWDPKYIRSLAELVDQISIEQIHSKRNSIPEFIETFDRQLQIDRTTRFINDLLEPN